MKDTLTELIGQQEWLEQPADSLQKAVADAFSGAGAAGEQIEEFLHGAWLGHPLHPALTDVPLGAWTVAVSLDAADTASGKDTFADGADAAVLIGLVGAAGSALTGLTDWHKTEGEARRVGVVHGLLNIGATALFATSWMLRRQKNRDAGKICALIGYAVVSASAYLGGSLVFEEQVGVQTARH